MSAEKTPPHTPGPWIWIEGELYQESAWREYDAWLSSPLTPNKWTGDDWKPRPEPIVETDSGAYGPRGNDKPLIAAAPDLLAALRECVQCHVELVNSGDCGYWNPETDAVIVQARAALAKAEAGREGQ